jgi:polyisoprenoid-binding protein YceI
MCFIVSIRNVWQEAIGMAWQVDPVHSHVGFSIRHMGVGSVRGRFEQFEAQVEIADGALKGVEAKIDVGSVNTRQDMRDNHLKSPDFFDAANHPTIAFKSKRVEPGSNGAFRIVGDLTIRGVTREVTLDGEMSEIIKDPQGNRRVGLSAQGTINRRDFDLNWNPVIEAGHLVAGDRVKLDIEVEATQPA